MSKQFKPYTARNIKQLPQISKLSKEQFFDFKVITKIQPFRTNNYVVDELIDWENFEEDPIYILNFPNREMLQTHHYRKMANSILKKESETEQKTVIKKIWDELNPHPAGQLQLNVPELDGKKVKGIQHKYNETVLFFPTQGQTCHAYCTFCFRWPQFVGSDDMKFTLKDSNILVEYLRRNKQVTDLLITGGDPLTMSANRLTKYIEAIVKSDLNHIKNIRIGTKVLSYWPYRFISDKDSDSILRLFESTVKAGKHLTVMAHFNHPRELSTKAVEEATKRIRKTGAVIRTQSPLLNHINENSIIWVKMWKDQVNMGMIPYYMFLSRDTGAQHYFAISLAKAVQIFKEAYNHVSGICRTVRGPSMSTGPGKIQIIGTTEVNNEKVFVLTFLQARDPKWVRKPFFAKFDESAIWLSDLEPAFGQKEFFYQSQYNKIIDDKIDDSIDEFALSNIAS